jgi:hypothetical protein
MAITKNIRFFDNQYITSSNSTVSSEHASYDFDNVLDPIRSKLYQPNGTNVWNIVWDLATTAPISFFGAIGKSPTSFTVSEAATITLQANNILSWSSPPFEETITPSDYGMFLQIDNSGGGYRYWKLDVDDSANPTQNEIGYMYLGDHVEIVNRDISKGFSKTIVDPSTQMVSLAGTRYFDERPKYMKFSNVGISHMEASERRKIEQMFFDFGIHDPFFVAFDPTLAFSTYDWELTKFVRFEGPPTQTNFYEDIFSMSFNLIEVV